MGPSGGGDSTAPTATLTAPADLAAGLTGMLALSATASDNVAVTGVEFQIDGVTLGAVATSAPYGATVDTSLYTSGQHVLRARASDAAGNVSAWSTALVQFGGSVSQPSGFTRNEAWIAGLVERDRVRPGGRRPDLRHRAGRRDPRRSRTAPCWRRRSPP